MVKDLEEIVKMQEIEGIGVGASGLDLTVDTEQYSPGVLRT